MEIIFFPINISYLRLIGFVSLLKDSNPLAKSYYKKYLSYRTGLYLSPPPPPVLVDNVRKGMIFFFTSSLILIHTVPVI